MCLYACVYVCTQKTLDGVMSADDTVCFEFDMHLAYAACAPEACPGMTAGKLPKLGPAKSLQYLIYCKFQPIFACSDSAMRPMLMHDE